MLLTTFYFELHQPFWLHPDRDKLLWDEKNRETFLQVSEKCYLPATAMFKELIARHPEFKITLSMSGTFMEQAELYQPDVIRSLQELINAGRENRQIEFLDETYYHSLASLFTDPQKQEFRDQITLHREMMHKLFGILPLSFRNTELIYNNNIAEVVADMGYLSIICEKRDDMFVEKVDGPVSPRAIFRAKGSNLIVIPRNRKLSDDITFRFPQNPVSPDEYASQIANTEGDVLLLGYRFEHIGEHIPGDKGIFDFWRGLPEALSKFPNIIMPIHQKLLDGSWSPIALSLTFRDSTRHHGLIKKKIHSAGSVITRNLIYLKTLKIWRKTSGGPVVNCLRSGGI